MVKSLVINMSIDYEFRPEEVRYTASPIFHIAGQGMIFLHVWRGFTTLVLPRFEAGPVLSWMQSGRLTGAFLVPTMISTLLDHPEITAGPYDAIRTIIYGGAHVAGPAAAGDGHLRLRLH